MKKIKERAGFGNPPSRAFYFFLIVAGFTVGSSAETWRGLVVAPEFRCSPYNSKEYSYSQSVEPRIVRSMGGVVYGPYTGTVFGSTGQTDIEHIVARSEAHDSGMCSRSASQKKEFASDLLNLTLASPSVNRHQKVDKDAAQWLPDLNRCWFANRVLQVRVKYQLTIDRREANTLEQVLNQCESVEMQMIQRRSETSAGGNADNAESETLARYDDNGNGRISCAEARAHGIAPVSRGHPAYQYMRDGDGDGVVCE